MHVDYSHQAELKPELEIDEEIRWTGKPKSGFLFRPSDFFLIPFSILWFGFSATWMVLAILGNAPILFILLGTPFLIIGFQLLIVRFYTDKKRRENTIYALTNQRILIFSSQPKKRLDFLHLKDIKSMEVKKHRDGFESLFFGTKYFPVRTNISVNWPGSRQRPVFEFIENAEAVEKLIMEELQCLP